MKKDNLTANILQMEWKASRDGSIGDLLVRCRIPFLKFNNFFNKKAHQLTSYLVLLPTGVKPGKLGKI